MAFLVCYSILLSDHAKDKAIYLDQRFYELIFRNCRRESSGFILLRQISLLRYTSPRILISAEQLSTLEAELDKLGTLHSSHSQIEEFKTVCQNAVQKGKSLTISGDMYRELHGGIFERLIQLWHIRH